MARKVARAPEAGVQGPSSPGRLRQVYPAIRQQAHEQGHNPSSPQGRPQGQDGRQEAVEAAPDPALKKVEKLDGIVEALRRGENFSIPRLTVLKGLGEDRRAAREFAL